VSGPHRVPSRPGTAVAVLKNLGSRLTQAERPPYEVPEHDVEVCFDEPTGEHSRASSMSGAAQETGKKTP
jgi:hypothetical protein